MKKDRKKLIVLLASFALLLTVSAVGTVAYLATQTEPVENVFVAPESGVEIIETFENQQTKECVSFKNTGEYAVYIRVALVPAWETPDPETGEYVPVGVAASLNDLTIEEPFPGTDWVYRETDGFYYYTKVVDAKSSTSNLITKAVVTTVNEYRMNLNILAQSIQAQGGEGEKSAAELAWGVDPSTLKAN